MNNVCLISLQLCIEIVLFFSPFECFFSWNVCMLCFYSNKSCCSLFIFRHFFSMQFWQNNNFNLRVWTRKNRQEEGVPWNSGALIKRKREMVGKKWNEMLKVATWINNYGTHEEYLRLHWITKSKRMLSRSFTEPPIAFVVFYSAINRGKKIVSAQKQKLFFF